MKQGSIMLQNNPNNCFICKKFTLYREVNHNLRYYSLTLCPTLFGEYLLTKEYGSVKNKKPTRVIKEYFSHFEDSVTVIEKFIETKIKKGYFKNTKA